MQKQNVFPTGDGEPTAMAQAFAKVGIHSGADLKHADAKLQELRGKLDSVQDLDERIALLKDGAVEYAQVWLGARRAFATLEREFGTPVEQRARTLENLRNSFQGWRHKAGGLAAEAEKALEVMAEVEEKNPYFREGITVLNRQAREETLSKLRENVEVESLRGFWQAVAARKDAVYVVEGTFSPKDTDKVLKGVIRLRSTANGLQVEDASHQFLKDSSKMRDGRPKVYHVNPLNSFAAVTGPELHPVLRDIMVAAWTREAKREEILNRKEEILGLSTISPQEFLNGKAGVAVVHHNKWYDGNQFGPATIAVEGNGEGGYRLTEYLSSRHEKKLKLVAEAEVLSLNEEGLNNMVGKMVKADARRAAQAQEDTGAVPAEEAAEPAAEAPSEEPVATKAGKRTKVAKS